MPGSRWALVGLAVFAAACTREPAAVATTSASSGAATDVDASTSSDGSGTVDTATSGTPLPADVGMPCDPTLAPGELTLLTDVAMGAITRFDMDHDDVLDAVGEHGLIVLHSEMVRPFDLIFAPNRVVPGRIAHGALADFLELRPNEQIRLSPDILETVSPTAPSVTDAPSGTVAVGDVDGDGRDDFAVSHAGEIQLWRSQGDGSFVGTEPAPASDVWSIAMASRGAPGRTHLATLTDSAIVFFEITENDLVEVEQLDTAFIYDMWASDFRGTGEIGVGFARYGGVLINVLSGVGVAHFADGQWVVLEHDLEGAMASGIGSADLDGDGDLDLVVGVGVDRIDLACLSPEGYTLCGRMTIDTVPQNIAVLEDPLRLVVSNADGTWIMPLPAPVCP